MHKKQNFDTVSSSRGSYSKAIVKLPYFDYLLTLLNQDNDAVKKSFGRHVHWGYWPQPTLKLPTVSEFANATEMLSQQVCLAGNIDNNASVLDVGCGFGGTVAYINENYTNMTLIGLNLDERQLQRARSLVVPKGNNYIDFQQGDACYLPFADQSFDIVLAVECIFHFADRRQFFAEVHRVLRPGGYFSLSDFVAHPVIVPLTKITLPEYFSVGFYGKCNLQYTTQHYRTLANQTLFTVQTERDITNNTLPTYSYLRWLAYQQHLTRKIAMLETITLEGLSRSKLLKYYIYGFGKKV